MYENYYVFIHTEEHEWKKNPGDLAQESYSSSVIN